MDCSSAMQRSTSGSSCAPHESHSIRIRDCCTSNGCITRPTSIVWTSSIAAGDLSVLGSTGVSFLGDSAKKIGQVDLRKYVLKTEAGSTRG